MTIKTFAKPANDSRRQFTRIFKLSLLLINLKERSILSILITFIKEILVFVKAMSTMEKTTIMKSI
jgi:hypothetical protein